MRLLRFVGRILVFPRSLTEISSLAGFVALNILSNFTLYFLQRIGYAMKIKYLALPIVLLLNTFLFPQNKRQSEFTLTNNAVYAPGDSIRVRLYAPMQMKSFTFRLFRLDNPVELMKSGIASRLSRDFDIWGKDKVLLAKYFSLQKEWNEVLQSSKNQYEDLIEIAPLRKAGIYLLQTLRDDQVAYCPIVVTNYAIIFKQTKKQILAFLTDAQTGKFIPETEFNFYRNDTLFNSAHTDKDGLLSIELPEAFKEQTSIILTAKVENETVFSNPYFFWGDQTERYTSYVYTNQPVYRPGEKVFFKSLLRKRNDLDFSIPSDKECNVVIRSPKNVEVFSGTFKTDEFGSFWGELVLDNEADIGQYSISITLGPQNFYGGFYVEEYKKPEYKVEVSTEKKYYLGGETISGKVKAAYYFGSPVKNAKVTVQVFKKRFWMPWWYWSPYNWFYKSNFRIGHQYSDQPDYLSSIDGEVNEEGEFTFEYIVDDSKDQDYTYEFYASVTDASRRAVSNTADAYVTRGAFTLSTSTNKYFVKLGETLNFYINAFDFSNMPIETDFKLIINKRSYVNYSYYDETVDKLYGSTDEKGKVTISYTPGKEGYYAYTVIAVDKNGKEISSTSSFYVNTEENCYYRRSGAEIEIVTDKEIYEKGDTLTAIISLPKSHADVLVSFEKSSLLSYKKYWVEDSVLTIRQVLTEHYCQNFSLSVLMVSDRRLLTNTKMIGVLNKEKFLTVEIKPEKGIYKPGEKAVYHLLVKNSNGDPVPNSQLSFGSVDESIYAIREDLTEDIRQAFYKPEYFHISTLFSLSGQYYYTRSRATSILDKNLPEMKEQKQTGQLLFEGKFIFDAERLDTSSITFLLVNESGYYFALAYGGGKFSFKNISAGEYEFCLITKDGKFRVIKKVTVDKNMTNVKMRQSGFETEELVEVLSTEANAGAALQMDKTVAIRGARVQDIKIEETAPLVTPKIRKNFVDAASWMPDIVTNEKGEAELSFVLPDNLTSWRATVRAITKNSEVGQETNIIISRKNLLVRIETPRFFRESDTLLITTNIHNYLSEKKKVKIAFRAKNLQLLSSTLGKNDELTVDLNDEARIDWKVVVEKVKPGGVDAELYVEALTNEESDAMQVSVPVFPNGVKQTFALNAVLKESTAEKTLTFSIPKSVDLATAELSFSLSPSLAGTLLKSVDDLVQYPYGCVEQTMSRFLPALIVANAFNELHIPLKEKTMTELPDIIQKGLNRLYSYQHYDGGWGWWENDETHPYMTAYVVYGMSLAKQAGYEIDTIRFQQGKRNLMNQLVKMKEEDQTTVAFMFNALAGTKELNKEKNFALLKTFVDNISRRESNAYALALFGAAYLKIGDVKREKKMFERLMDNIYESDQLAYWKGKEFHYRWTDDNVQSTAFALKYLITEDPQNPIISKIVTWLLSKQQGYSWNSTQQTAAVLFALTDYLKVSKELEPDYTVSVLVNGDKIAEKQFNTSNVFEKQERLTFTEDQMKKIGTGENKLTLVKSGKGALYFSGYDRYYIAPNEAMQKNTFTVKKECYKLEEFTGTNGIVYKKQRVAEPLKNGDAVFVKLTVQTKEEDLQYFMLEDPFPSGFEIEKNEEHYQIDGEDQYDQYSYRNRGYSPRRWFWASKEIRDEKIAFFVTYPQKEMVFTYIIKAQIPGTYSWLPAEASLMYYPEVNGLSEIGLIKVSEMK